MFYLLLFLDFNVDSGVHPCLYSICHYHIMYCKLNLSIKYPPPYMPLVGDYNKANVESIKKSIDSVNWELMFSKECSQTGTYF